MRIAEGQSDRRTVTGLVILLMVPAVSLAQAPPAPPGWLAGCWQQTGPAHTVEEVWFPPSGGMTIGMSRTVAADTLLLWEFMAIRPVDGALAFEASPHGQTATLFPVVEYTDSTIAFENPGHDFPQRIMYAHRQGDSLLATVSGTARGRARTINFEYARTACPA